MCTGESSRPSFGGTIAVLFPREHTVHSNVSSDASLSSSPSSVTSSFSSSSSLSSYSLFFRDTVNKHTTSAIFHVDDPDTYQALRRCQQLDLRIEKYGDLTASTSMTAPLHHFQLDVNEDSARQTGRPQAQMELELPERLDLTVSEKGVVGRQVTVTTAGGTVLGVGVVGYN